MNINNDLKLELFAEDYIRAKLLEAENYRMLKHLRKRNHKGLLHPFLPLLGWLGRILILLGERLEGYELTSATWTLK